MKHIILALMFISLTTNAHATVTSSGTNGTIQPPKDINLSNFSYRDTCIDSDHKCEDRIIKEISQASRFILYQTDTFKSLPIAVAIADASEQKGMITELIYSVSEFKPNFTASTIVAKKNVIRYANFFNRLKNNETIIIDGNTLIVHSDGVYTFIKNNPVVINKYIRSVLEYRSKSIDISKR